MAWPGELGRGRRPGLSWYVRLCADRSEALGVLPDLRRWLAGAGGGAGMADMELSESLKVSMLMVSSW